MGKYHNNVNYVSYYTRYRAKGDRNVKLDYSHACFAEILNRGVIKKQYYEIYICTDLQFVKDTNYSNYCLLPKTELIDHIHQARRLFKFEYSVEDNPFEYREKKYSGFLVKLNIDLPHFYHRYLLTWIRYAYEFPFNIILFEARRLKKLVIQRETVSNLFIVVSRVVYNAGAGFSSGHSISTYRSLLLKETSLKARLLNMAGNSGSIGRLNDIYPNTNDRELFREEAQSENRNYVDYWTDFDAFVKRIPKYMEHYNRLVLHKQ